MGKERVKIYEVQRQESSSYRFSVCLSMSEGPMYLVGFRLLDDGRMVSPSAKAGAYWIPLVILPKNLRAAVKNKALAAIAKGAANGDT